MSQFLGYADQAAKINLRALLSKHNVPVTVYKLLCDESITIAELITFTNEDLKDWCNEHSLKTIERRRFLNAVKSLPNANANRKIKDNDHDHEPKIVPVFLGNEEKEQLNQFDEMKNNVENMMNYINQLKNELNVDKVIKEINNICDDIQSHVEKLRTNLLNEVCTYEII